MPPRATIRRPGYTIEAAEEKKEEGKKEEEGKEESEELAAGAGDAGGDVRSGT
jgi:hypothetical protein